MTDTNDKRPDQKRAEEQIIHPLIARMVELGVLPEPDRDYTITWEDIAAQAEMQERYEESN